MECLLSLAEVVLQLGTDRCKCEVLYAVVRAFLLLSTSWRLRTVDPATLQYYIQRAIHVFVTREGYPFTRSRREAAGAKLRGRASLDSQEPRVRDESENADHISYRAVAYSSPLSALLPFGPALASSCLELGILPGICPFVARRVLRCLTFGRAAEVEVEVEVENECAWAFSSRLCSLRFLEMLASSTIEGGAIPGIQLVVRYRCRATFARPLFLSILGTGGRGPPRDGDGRTRPSRSRTCLARRDLQSHMSPHPSHARPMHLRKPLSPSLAPKLIRP